MSKSRKARARRRRKAVDRTERVKPSQMAEAKKRPWIMQQLLERGPDNLGTTAEQHEASIEIVEAFDALTSAVSCRSSTLGGSVARANFQSGESELSPRLLRLICIYLGWATELFLRRHLRAPVVVEWITDARILGCSHIPMLVRSLDLWSKHRDEWRAPRLTPQPSRVLTAALHEPRLPHSARVPHLPAFAIPRVPHAAAPIPAPRAMAQAHRAAGTAAPAAPRSAAAKQR